MNSNFDNQKPFLFKKIRDDFSEVPRFLGELGEALAIAYSLSQHKLFRINGKDLYLEEINDPIIYEIFNRTIIERTISESEHYGRVVFSGKKLLFSSKGLEMSLGELETIWIIISKYEKNKENLDEQFKDGLFMFGLQGAGQITAIIKYLLDACQNMILLIRKKIIEDRANELTSNLEKKEFFLRTQKEILKQEYQTRVIKDGILKLLDIELEYLEKIEKKEIGNETLTQTVQNFSIENISYITGNHNEVSQVTSKEKSKKSFIKKIMDIISRRISML